MVTRALFNKLPRNLMYSPCRERATSILVLIRSNKERISRSFAFNKYKGHDEALEAALQYRSELYMQLYGTTEPQTAIARPPKKISTRRKGGTGTITYHHTEHTDKHGETSVYQAALCRWRENGVTRSKSFSFGGQRVRRTKAEAYEEARNFLNAKIDSLAAGM